MALADKLPYFPRPALLRKVLRPLVSGANVTLFAPRRHGKTLFVREELLPAAAEHGWFAARVDLWRNREHPALGMVEGLEAVAYARQTASQPFWARRMDLKKLRASLKTPGVDIEGHWEPAADLPPPLAGATLENRLANALQLISRHGSHALLALDEFQSLAHADENLIAAFRTALQDLEGSLSVVFTGSSREGLNRLFRRANAPLFRSAIPIQLDPMRDDFVESRADYLADIADLTVDRDQLKLLFERLLRTPHFLNEIVFGMLVSGDADVAVAMKAWLQDKSENEYPQVLGNLKPLDLAMVNWLAESGEESVYSARAREHMQAFLGIDTPPGTPVVQTCIRRLTKLGVVDPTGTTGGYQLADPGMQIMLRELAAEHALHRSDAAKPER